MGLSSAKNTFHRKETKRQERETGGAFYREKETETGERRVGFSSGKKKKMVLSRRKRGTKEARGREKGENLTENLLIRQILTDSSRFRIPYMAPTMQLLVLRPNPIAVEWSIRDRCSCTSLTLGFLDFIKFDKHVCCMFSSVVSLHFSCV